MQPVLPVLSVVIPYYNQGKLLYEAIESVEAAEKNLYEIIVVNDGSTDEASKKIAEDLARRGYHVINQENKGLGAARNTGIQAAKGEFILPLDSDNKIKPQYITESIAILKRDQGIGVVYGNPVFFGDVEKKRKFKPFEFNRELLLFVNYIDACAVYRKELWQQVSGYDETMPWMGLEDWDLWLRMSDRNVGFHHLDKEMFYYRVVKNSMISEISDTRLMDNYRHIVKKNSERYSSYLFSNMDLMIGISLLSRTKLGLLKFLLKIVKRLPV
jgi:glycosyltransferase involved in cell wall biosynthesis